MSRTPARALGAGEFVPLAALLMSLVALSIDTMLPALPAMGRDLGAARPNDVQFVVTALFVGLGLGQLLVGPLSDAIGRKPAIRAGILVFLAGCLVSMFAPTFEAMIAGRVLQGFGAAAPRIVTMALVRDQYSGRRMARLMSFILGVFVFIPTVAPAIGQAILWVADWRAIFATFFVVGAVALGWFSLRHPETLPRARRRPFSLRSVLAGARETLGIRSALGYTIAAGFAFAPFIAYLSSAQQIFQEAYRTGAWFPFWFGALSLAIGLAAFVNGRLVMRHGMRRLSTVAAASVSVASAAAWGLAFAYDGLPPFGLFAAYLFPVFFGVGLLFGNLNALAMKELGHIAGVGAAVVASVSLLIAAPLGALVAGSFDGTMYPQIGAFAVFGAAAVGALRWAGGGRGPTDRNRGPAAPPQPATRRRP